MGQAERNGDEPVRNLVRQMVTATPFAAVVAGCTSVVLGGSLIVTLWILVLGLLMLAPRVRTFIPKAHDHVIAGWYAALAVSASLLALNPATFGLAGAVATLSITGAHVVRIDRIRRTVLAGVIIIQMLGVLGAGMSRPHIWTLVALIGIAVATENMDALHQSIVATSEQRLEAMASDRSTLLHLYQIASSIGASTTLSEALPDLLQSISTTVGVRTCAIALFDADAKELRLRGPMWINGMPGVVEGEIAVEAVDGSFAERALRSTRAVRFDRRTAGCMRKMFDDLGLESGLVAPIRLEGLLSGLVIVGDSARGWFEPEHLDVLTEVAGPVGLVMSQVARYEEAALLAQRLQEVADMKTDLVATVSHELRNPLTSVIGSIDLLKRLDLAKDPELTDELVSAADRQSRRLKRMIDDLLTVSRFDRGLVRAAPEPVVLAEMIDQAIWVVDGAPVSVDIPAGLEVVADRDHLHQILVNLIENATKFADGSPIQVGAGLLDSGDVVVAVVDHGPGIDPADRARVFDRFVQLSRGSRPSGGGLGLAIVKMLAEGMGGKVDVFETPGGGATFAVRLPGVQRRRSWTAA